VVHDFRQGQGNTDNWELRQGSQSRLGQAARAYPMIRQLFRISLFITLISVISPLAVSQTSPQSTSSEAADELFRSRNWEAAAKAYKSITKKEQSNGQAWFRLGVALHATREYSQAITALQQSYKLRFQPQLSLFTIGRAYAKLNQKDLAFDWLTRAVRGGFSQKQQLNTHPDLAVLRDDSRFQDLLELLEKETRPCQNYPEYKQFDFLIGTWEVTSQGNAIATSRVEYMVDGCMLVEEYTQGSGYGGKNLTYYDAALGKWRQTWIQGGNVSEYLGGLNDGAMRLEGETHSRNGEKQLIREVYYPQGTDRVRQTSEISTNGGKTWTLTYDITYTKKK
jgi:tetratricopeptide (TPR) repeat protein